MINRALHEEGIKDTRADRIRQSPTGHLLGTATSSTTARQLLAHRDLVLQAARGIDPSIRGLVPQLRWGWIRIHGLSVLCYGGNGGLKGPRRERETGNEGVQPLADQVVALDRR